MDILTWLIVGLVAGVLASLVVGGSGFGIVGDIIAQFADPLAFYRELVQNAHDSCVRRRIEENAEFVPKIVVRGDVGIEIGRIGFHGRQAF